MDVPLTFSLLAIYYFYPTNPRNFLMLRITVKIINPH